MNPKPIYLSKTVIVNVLAVVCVIFGVQIAPDQQAEIAAGLLALANIGLRFLTHTSLENPVARSSRSSTYALPVVLFAALLLQGCQYAAGAASRTADVIAGEIADEVEGYCELSSEARTYARGKVNGKLPRGRSVTIECGDEPAADGDD